MIYGDRAKALPSMSFKLGEAPLTIGGGAGSFGLRGPVDPSAPKPGLPPRAHPKMIDAEAAKREATEAGTRAGDAFGRAIVNLHEDAMTKLTTIDFHDDTLFAIRDGETVRVALKPIADRLGLDWSSQAKRTKRDPILAQGMVILTIPSAGGARETATLPLHLLPGWLFGIGANQVKLESRDLVLTYQRECFAVLFSHFYGRRDAVPVADAGPAREEPVSVRRGLVTEARQTFGCRAAGSLWFALGLPIVPEMREGRAQGAFGFTYTAAPPRRPAPDTPAPSAAGGRACSSRERTPWIIKTSARPSPGRISARSSGHTARSSASLERTRSRRRPARTSWRSWTT